MATGGIFGAVLLTNADWDVPGIMGQVLLNNTDVDSPGIMGQVLLTNADWDSPGLFGRLRLDAGPVDYLAAARQANRRPVILLEAQSRDAVRDEVSAASDWQASKSLPASADVGSVPGTLRLLTTTAHMTVDPVSGGYRGITVPYDCWVDEVEAFWGGGQDPGDVYVYQLRIRKGTGSSPAVLLDWGAVQNTHWGAVNLGRGAYMRFGFAPQEYDSGEYANVGLCRFAIYGQPWSVPVILFGSAAQGVVHYTARSTTVQTRTMDLLTVSESDNTIQIDDVKPFGTGVVYTARGSNDGSAWTNLGTVTDGATLDPYRYYDVTATLTGYVDATNRIQTPVVKRIAIIRGDSSFRWFGTHPDIPRAGITPAISRGGVSAAAAKINLDKVATGGSMSAKLAWVRPVSDWLADTTLKGRIVSCSIGFESLSPAHFRPYFAGVFDGWSGDPAKGEVTVKFRDVWKLLDNKIPEETVDGSGTKTTTPVTWTDTNVVDVMLGVLDLLNVPDRFIDAASFEEIRDGDRSGADWLVSRTITDPTKGTELLAQLTLLSGVYLYPAADGRLTAVLLNPAGPVQGVLDADVAAFGDMSGGYDDLASRVVIYYSLSANGDPDSKEDYAKAHIYVNTEQEQVSDPIVKELLVPWTCTTAAVTSMAYRMGGFYTTPLLRFKVQDVPPWLFQVQPGQLVAIDNLPVPVLSAAWPGRTNHTRAAVMSKTTDPDTHAISLELMQLGSLTTG